MSQRTKGGVVIHKKHLKRCILYYRVVGYLLGYNKKCFFIKSSSATKDTLTRPDGLSKAIILSR